VSEVRRVGLVALYRWRLHAGHEEAFSRAWSNVTAALRQRGSLGSRLHRGPEGIWYGYAQWPDEATRQAAFAEEDAALAGDRAAMRAAIAERLPELLLEPVADFLVLPTE
jgi:hypothetical protein